MHSRSLVFAGMLCLAGLVNGAIFPIIFRGKVTMEDGTPPPRSVGIQRVCSGMNTTQPGPLTNKNGEFIWRLAVDTMDSRMCHLEATWEGHVSTTVDITRIDGTSPSVTLPTLLLRPRVIDPLTIMPPAKGPPAKAAPAWNAAVQAVNAGEMDAATSHLKAAVQAVPKFAEAWHGLGVIYDLQFKFAEARDAYERAIAGDPKFLYPYVTLARVTLKAKDWQATANAADGLLKVDKKKTFPIIYLHQAVARYQLKDLAGAEASAREAIKLDPGRKMPRAEFVLGRILEAKGDNAGAVEHITAYIELDPSASDIEKVKAYLQNLGKEAGGPEPELEIL